MDRVFDRSFITQEFVLYTNPSVGLRYIILSSLYSGGCAKLNSSTNRIAASPKD